MEMVSEAKELPRRRLIYGVLYLLLLIFPFKAGPYWTDVATFFGIYVLLGLSLNIIVGEVGLFNMGHAAFYALGPILPAFSILSGDTHHLAAAGKRSSRRRFRLYPHQAHHSLAGRLSAHRHHWAE